VLALAVPNVRQSEAPFRTTGAFFALSVADTGASSRWYQEKFGMRVIFDPPRSSDAKVVLEGGGLTVELIQMDSAKALREVAPAVRGSISVHGIAKVGFFVESYDQTLGAPRARGVEIAMGPFPKSATQPANVLIRDNAGNLIQLFAR
jgi:hypothetical protein